MPVGVQKTRSRSCQADPCGETFGGLLAVVDAQVGDERGWQGQHELGFPLAVLLRAACPHVPDSAIMRFEDRPFLEMDRDRKWRYSLHAILRDAVRDADAGFARLVVTERTG